MSRLTKDQIIDRLAKHQPIAPAQARASIVIRWTATVALISMVPLGVILANHNNPVIDNNLWWLSLLFIALGGLGSYIAWRASSKKEAERQFGMAPLSIAECRELEELSSIDPEVQQIVDHWVEAWVGAGAPPRGRDLGLLREMNRALRYMGVPTGQSSAPAPVHRTAKDRGRSKMASNSSSV